MENGLPISLMTPRSMIVRILIQGTCSFKYEFMSVLLPFPDHVS